MNVAEEYCAREKGAPAVGFEVKIDGKWPEVAVVELCGFVEVGGWAEEGAEEAGRAHELVGGDEEVFGSAAVVVGFDGECDVAERANSGGF